MIVELSAIASAVLVAQSIILRLQVVEKGDLDREWALEYDKQILEDAALLEKTKRRYDDKLWDLEDKSLYYTREISTLKNKLLFYEAPNIASSIDFRILKLPQETKYWTVAFTSPPSLSIIDRKDHKQVNFNVGIISYTERFDKHTFSNSRVQHFIEHELTEQVTKAIIKETRIYE